jgi:hypothetical protein
MAIMRRPAHAAVGRRALLLLPVAWPAATQEAPALLRPGERIVFPEIAFTVLGVSVQRHQRGTNVTLRMRAQSGEDRDVSVGLDAVRLIAAGVPREPVYDTLAERQTSFFYLQRDSALDFRRVFRIPDRTNDLVLQLRIDGVVERRRLPAE